MMNQTMKRVAVVGATGYAGSELTSLLARHPHAELAGVYSSGQSRAVSFASLHPGLAGLTGPTVDPFDFETVAAANFDTVFLATPNEVSAEIAPKLLDRGAAVIDLSGAFRLSESREYPKWYGFDHPRPEMLNQAIYGLPEWCNGELKGARLIANPGCYPTAILLALRPLTYLLNRDHPLICDAKSGVSGAGKKAELSFSFSELSNNFKAYNVGHHRHEPELRQYLRLGEKTPLVFVPHLLPINRGILATLHVSFMRSLTATELSEIYQKAYANAPFVRILPAGELPELKNVVGTPRADIGFVMLNGGSRAVIVSVIDNLLKGAASQAVQNFNRMWGFAEVEGLA